MKTSENYAIQFLALTIMKDKSERRNNKVCPDKGRILLEDQLEHLKDGEPVLSELTKQLLNDELNRLRIRHDELSTQGHVMVLNEIKSQINDLENIMSR